MRQIDEDLVNASRNGHTEVVQLLLNARADVHARNDWAIRRASSNGHTEVVQLLLAHYRENNLKIPTGYRIA